MPRLLAFLQFIIVGVGVFTLHLVVKITPTADHPALVAEIAPLLARYGLWFFAVPILWTLFFNAARGKLPAKAINAIGITLTILLALVIGIPLALYLS